MEQPPADLKYRKAWEISGGKENTYLFSLLPYTYMLQWGGCAWGFLTHIFLSECVCVGYSTYLNCLPLFKSAWQQDYVRQNKALHIWLHIWVQSTTDIALLKVNFKCILYFVQVPALNTVSLIIVIRSFTLTSKSSHLYWLHSPYAITKNGKKRMHCTDNSVNKMTFLHYYAPCINTIISTINKTINHWSLV